MTRFGVLGSGAVGMTLASGLKAHGYEVRIASRSPAKLADYSKRSGIAAGSFEDVAAWSEAIVLAVLGEGAAEALQQAGKKNLSGKLVIDATNPIKHEPPTDGVLKFFTSLDKSLMETLQAAYPDARFVKAFNSVGSALMVNPKVKGGPPTMFYCGNDAAAKKVVAELLARFGWEAADMGSAIAARAIEPLCILWCIPGFLSNDWSHAFRVVRP
jgi:8-hydroxy-5-deazaflavin:NADPH oxidoreductase